MSSSVEITVARSGLNLFLAPVSLVDSSDLRAVLTWKKVYRPDPATARKMADEARKVGKRPPRVLIENVELFSIQQLENGDKVLVTYAGFKDRILEFFKTTRPALTVNYVDMSGLDNRLRPTPIPDVEYRYKQKEAIEAIASTTDNGVIHCVTAWGKTFCVNVLASMYKSSNIIVMSPRVDLLVEMEARLSKEGIAFGVFGNKKKIPPVANAHGGTLTLTTMQSVKACEEYGLLRNCDLLIGDEVHGLITPQALAGIKRMFKARMIGLTATMDRNDNGKVCIEAFFGPPLLRVEYQEAVEAQAVAPVDVFMVSTPIANMGSPDHDVVFNRKLVWSNYQRNTLITDVAASLVGEFQTLVLCDTLIHAFNVWSMLKARGQRWGLVYGSPPAKGSKFYSEFVDTMKSNNIHIDSSKWIDAVKQAFLNRQLMGIVATKKWNTGIDIPNLDVLIAASTISSQVACQQGAGRVSRIGDDESRIKRGVVIDFEDTFNPRLADKSARRRRQYAQEQGWTISRNFPAADVLQAVRNLKKNIIMRD